MGKAISHIDLDETLGLTECTDGFWLYDTTRGMNLSMKAKTKDDAFFDALKYYQRRLTQIEHERKALHDKVSQIAEIVAPEVDDEFP